MTIDSKGGFTPGPWSATNHFADDTTPCNCAYVLCDGYAGSICDISVGNGLPIGEGGNDSPPREEAAANARLIASAPDLLEALQPFAWALDELPDEAAADGAVSICHSSFTDGVITFDHLRKARTAISKALGTEGVGE